MNINPIDPGNRPYRLPVTKILVGALFICWSNWKNLVKGLLPTVALILAVGLVWQLSGIPLSNPVSVFFVAVSMLLFAKFAVICNRLVLVDFNAGSRLILPFSWSERETHFVRRMIIVYALTSIGSIIISMVPLAMVAQSLPEAQRNDPAALFPFAILLAGIPAIYLLGRMSLVFPATAVDAQTGLAWAWNKSRGNGIRLAIIVGLIPWISAALEYYLTRIIDGTIASVISSLVNYLLIVIEITALSLAYRELVQQKPASTTD
jgi:hypothetical protein